MECQCSEEHGPCEEHADVLVVRQGAALHSGDELTLLLVSDLIDCGVSLTEGDQVEYNRLSEAIKRDSHSGVAHFDFEDDDYSDFEAAADLVDRVEAAADGLWIAHEDGYVIYRPHPNCPLLN